MNDIESIPLHEAARYRYLSYAMSVITSRALPDVRDGLKPVQRRILYAMYHNLKLQPQGRYRKSAAVVGEVMAKYHPHGDSSIYDAMVRLAQPFSLRHPLVDGQGNFGSMDGDAAAAMRYTEAKLRPLSIELLSELKQQTISYRPTYDGQLFEPIVLPAQFPNLLINGAEGIAVGMSTRIPPHNFREVIDACVRLIDNPDATAADLAKKIRGPDFPTGGVLLNETEEIKSFYEKGQGSFRLRGCWNLEKEGRTPQIIVTAVPYGVNKATLIEKIGDLIANKKVPQLVDIRDESTEDVRIVLSFAKTRGTNLERDMAAAMGYLCRYTPLQTTFPMNLTCLIPTDNPDVATPIQANIRDILHHWLKFRLQTVQKRFEYELNLLNKRIHILNAFAVAFDVLDEIIAIIRASEGRRDAHEKLIDRFGFDDEQTDAILDLRLYRLAKLEIHVIKEELAEKLAEVARIEGILSSSASLWDVVRHELKELRKLYGEPRRTTIGGESAEVELADESSYIIEEDTYVIVTSDGWIKRQGRFSQIEKIRIRDGDSIMAIAHATTKQTVSFFSTLGGVYVMRIDDIPSTSGYGDPLQKYFSFADGERLAGVICHDPRSLPRPSTQVEIEDPNYPPPYGIALTKKGRAIRFSLSTQSEPTNKVGRRYMKPNGKDDSVFCVYPAAGNESLCMATLQGRALCVAVGDITLVRNPGKGVFAMKLQDKNDGICAAELSALPMEGPEVETSRGRELKIYPKKYKGTRAGKGSVIIQRGTLGGWQWPVQRFDLLHAEDQNSDSVTEASSEDSSTSEDLSTSEDSIGSSSFQEDYTLEATSDLTESSGLSNIPLPFTNFDPQGDDKK
ncbi:MAG: DNA gyrase/topoisomerase IV subunit A [Myxococcota bacterium]